MSKAFDMELFLSGTLKGAPASQRRHVRQAKVMQMAIEQRWQRKTPWSWQMKHVLWFLEVFLQEKSASTQYYYSLTACIISRRIQKYESWKGFLRKTRANLIGQDNTATAITHRRAPPETFVSLKSNG
jgi:hypothetical protein